MIIGCILPIKYESVRVPQKNFRLINGKPLFCWIISKLMNIDKINYIIIDTDSQFIINSINTYFTTDKIIYINRPKELQGGHISTNLLIKNIIDTIGIDIDIYVQTHITNPLLKQETIEDAIDKFIEFNDSYDSLFSVKVHKTRFYDKKGKELNHNRFNLIPTQNLEEIYEENSCIYVFTKYSMNKYNSRIGKNPYIYKMNDIESMDIDYEEDFLIAEQFLKLGF